MGGTQYFLKKFGTVVLENIPDMGAKTVETFWIVKASKNSNVVLTLKENNSTFPDVVEEEIVTGGMGL